MRVDVVDNLHNVDASQWNSLAGASNPFLRHEFLSALETCGCATRETGWFPQHLLLRDACDGRLLGAAPAYLKTHSYGEYVFDWAWANVYARARVPYYPKLVIAVPFTPATGPRLLVHPEAARERAERALVNAARERALEKNASSVHWLFPSKDEAERLIAHDLLCRVGYQFHWENRGYRDFDDFLATFSSQKRNKVRRERRQVADAGLEFEVVTGSAISERHWDDFHAFYRATTLKYGAIPYLTRAFFTEIGRAMPDQVLLVFACKAGQYVAGALNFLGSDTLYGRYWGCREEYHSLHFETCYYRAIEFCIAHGLQRFEAGAQGEHKLSRGFLPTPVYSAHWLKHPALSDTIARAVAVETRRVIEFVADARARAPYRTSPA